MVRGGQSGVDGSEPPKFTSEVHWIPIRPGSVPQGGYRVGRRALPRTSLRRGLCASDSSDPDQSLQLLFEYLHEEKIVNNDPTLAVDVGEIAPHRSKRDVRSDSSCPWIPRSDVNALVDSVPQPELRNRCIVLLLYYTGSRRSDVADLRLEDLCLETRTATIEPQDGPKTVRWHQHLTPLLDEWLNEYRPQYPRATDSEYVFLSEQAEQLHPNHISRIVRESAERAGIQEVLYTDQRGNDRRKSRLTPSVTASPSTGFCRRIQVIRRPSAACSHSKIRVLSSDTKMLYGRKSKRCTTRTSSRLSQNLMTRRSGVLSATGSGLV